MKRGPGRPKKTAALALSSKVTVCLRREDVKRLTEFANWTQRNVSDVVREVVTKFLKEHE
jgi:GTP cyclohydrolase FolE2